MEVGFDEFFYIMIFDNLDVKKKGQPIKKIKINKYYISPYFKDIIKKIFFQNQKKQI